LPLGIEQPYSYAIPPGMSVAPGACVRVPIGTREIYGLVWETRQGVAGGNLKPIKERMAMPPLRAEMRQFIQRVSDYTLSPIGLVAKMAMRDPRILVGLPLSAPC
jgi:primosomal protein N' (replication factor Y) (superfamily II helicase)